MFICSYGLQRYEEKMKKPASRRRKSVDLFVRRRKSANFADEIFLIHNKQAFYNHKKMYMNKLFTLLMFVVCSLSMNAQHSLELSVVPGSKGPLPDVPVLPPLEGKHIAGLTLSQVSFHQWSWYDAYEADLYFPSFTAEEAEYCTLQTRTNSSNVWETVTNTDGSVPRYSSAAMVSPIISVDTYYRIMLHNGTKDGYTSNEVFAPMPTINYTFIQRSHYYTETPYVGVKYTGSWVEAERRKRVWDSGKQRYNYELVEACYTYSTSYYHRQWYRMNPNTSEMFPIEGATEPNYTPTVEDLGYGLIEEIKGDDVHCSYYRLFGHGIVKSYIQASVDYIGSDGFVLNTDYILPEGGKDLRVFGNGEVARENIRERKPGQYAVYTPIDEENPYYGVTYQVDDIWDTGDYPLQFDRGTEGDPWLRPAQIYMMMYEDQPIVAKSSDNEPVEVWGHNIDDEWNIVETLDASQLTEENPYFSMLWGKYYLKSPGTATTLPTYYPNALLWSDAQLVEPGVDYDESYNMLTRSFSIEAVAKPAPLTGSGTITGTVTMGPVQAVTRAASAFSPMVYLKQNGGDVVAYAEPDATGSYTFQNVPDGSYQVLVNIDACIMEQPIDVTLSADKREASNIDYLVENGVIKRDDPDVINLASGKQPTVEGYYSIDGRQGRTHGLNIVRMSDGTIRKVMLK